MRSRLWLMTGFLLLAGSGLAQAGNKQAVPVSIDKIHGIIQGQYGSTRNSEDGVQAIIIEVQGNRTAGSQLMRVFARTAGGTEARCFTENVPLMGVLQQAFGTDSLLSVQYDTSNGRCIAAIVRAGSFYEPKR